MTERTTKRCRGCGAVKTLDQFAHEATVRDGRRSRCRSCDAVRYATYRASRVRGAAGLALVDAAVTGRLEDGAIPEPNTGCWLWTRRLGPAGYGALTVRGRPQLAHRVAYVVHRGPIPDGLWVLHRCDTPACVNPAHLFLGTHTDNVRDMVAKGRVSRHGANPLKIRGELNCNAKLTADDVRAIRAAHAGGASQRGLARDYGVTHQLIGFVVRGEIWRHVTQTPDAAAPDRAVPPGPAGPPRGPDPTDDAGAAAGARAGGADREGRPAP